MRNPFFQYDGGAIVGAPSKPRGAAPEALREPKSQLRAAGKPTFAAPYVDLDSLVVRAGRRRAEAIARLARRFIGWIKEASRRALQSDVERYLAQSTDLADLERRLQAVARGERPIV